MASWVYWLADIFESRHPLPIQDRRPKTWHELVVMLTLLAVGFLVTTSAIEQIKKIGKKADQAKIEKENETKTDPLSERANKSENEPESTKKPAISINEKLGQNLRWHLLLLLILGIPFYMVSKEQLDDFGFRKFGVGSQIVDGCVGFIISLAPVSLAFFITMQYRSLDTVHPLLKLVGPELGWGNFALLSISAVVMAPLLEELVFRVLFQGFLQDRLNPAVAIILTSLAFGFIHGWPNMIPIFALSLVLGYFFYRTNSYLTVVVLHALFNLYNLLNVLL